MTSDYILVPAYIGHDYVQHNDQGQRNARHHRIGHDYIGRNFEVRII